MTDPASFTLGNRQQRWLMAAVFFIGVLLLLIAVAVMGAALLGALPAQSANFGLAPLISGIASVLAAVFLAH
ncbi:MAG: hypothetical protein ACX931_00470 [Saccharospirillum sp.]